MQSLVLTLAITLLAALPARAAFETRAGAAWVYDMTTGTVLLKNRRMCRCRRPACPS